VKRAGDTPALGDILGHPQEPYERWARIVGFRKDDCKPIHQVIIRLFANPNERWPSGEYRTTGFLIPWEQAS
jgi:hypothetical protein